MIRHAEAQWNGSIKEGSGHVKVETGALDSPYSFKSRFVGGGETNPEELAKSAATPVGAASYRLRNASDLHADALKGQRVQAKGVFNKSGNTLTVSVQSLERAGAGCDK